MHKIVQATVYLLQQVDLETKFFIMKEELNASSQMFRLFNSESEFFLLE